MTSTTVVEEARRLAPELSERAAEGEQQRTMPADLVEKIRSAGLFHLGFPAALGGQECDPLTIVETIEAVSRADGSAGWTTFIGNTTAFVAWLEPAVAKEMVAERPDFVASGVFAPMGTARHDGDSFVIDGRWPFNSGCPHADWFMNGVIVMDGDGPRMVPPGRPDWRFAFYPAAEGEILDTWHVAGLRGTGSHDVTATSVRVPRERTIMPFFEPAKFDGPLFRLPFPTLLASFMSGFPLGVARRALDEFTALAQKKSRTIPPGPTMAEDAAIQVELARAEAAVRSARAFVIESIGAGWEAVSAGDEVSLSQRATIGLATLNAARTARTSVDSVFTMAGGGALYDSSPLQRCVRDLMAGTQHIIFSMNQWKTVGRVFLGLDPASFTL
jgi:alkylation response protein AidB-like acyl-CoA dehydrogenase